VYEAECLKLLDSKLEQPAYDFCIACSHLFNLLDARSAISVAERVAYIARVRKMAKAAPPSIPRTSPANLSSRALFTHSSSKAAKRRCRCDLSLHYGPFLARAARRVRSDTFFAFTRATGGQKSHWKCATEALAGLHPLRGGYALSSP